MIFRQASKRAKSRVWNSKILVVALAFAAMVTLSYVFMSNIVRGNLVRSADGVLDVTETRITAYLRELEATIERFADQTHEMVLQGESIEAFQEYMDDLSRFTLADDGTFSNIHSFYGYFETLPGGPAMIGSDLRALPENVNPRESEWYKLAVDADGNIVETVPAIQNASETIFSYAKCILDGEGKRLGVVCINVQIDTIGREIVDTALNQGGYGMLLNSDLLILSHPNPDFVGRYANDPVIPLSRGVADDLQNGREVIERPMTSYKNEKAVAFFRELSNGWYLGLVTPQGQYYQSMNSMAVTLCALGVTLAAILIFILIRIDLARAKSDDENKKKSLFLANMSHEIRTPINAIVGMTAIGRAAGTAERKNYCFSKIDSASKHLLGVVNDILDISKIEANKIELSATDFSFEKMLQQAVNVANFRADEKRQKLTIRIDKAIPKYLYADDQRLAQVITNLLSNAIKFTPDEGTIGLRATFVDEENGLCTVKVEVTDTGIGISPEQQAKLFQPFQQATSSTTRKYGGTGLGLAISKSIVEMMGGKIWVKSEFGKGTAMAFTVKVKRGEGSHFDLGRRGVNWANVRILAIDDDPDILFYFQETVVGFGGQCAVAASADEALRLIESEGAYNIYFVDLRMPDVDGISLTKEIRSREKNPGNSIVIMISSADLSAAEHDAKKAGVNKFLLKPLFPSSIADVISECIGIVNERTEEEPLDIDGIFEGRHVLFAEDVDINREIVLTLLAPTLLEIDCAENGVEAVKMFSEAPEKYDMIFMDVQMPEMDGHEATRQIRALGLPTSETIPIVAMTANVFREDIDECLAAGMNGHLGKPLDMDEVIRQLYKYLHADGAAHKGGSSASQNTSHGAEEGA